MRFEVLTAGAATIKIAVYGITVPCSPVGGYEYYGGTSYLILQGRNYIEDRGSRFLRKN
jgi:hypothetical protein